MTEYRCLDCREALGRSRRAADVHKAENPSHEVIGRYITSFVVRPEVKA